MVGLGNLLTTSCLLSSFLQQRREEKFLAHSLPQNLMVPASDPSTIAMCWGFRPAWRGQAEKERSSSDSWGQHLGTWPYRIWHLPCCRPPFPACSGGSRTLWVPAITWHGTTAPLLLGFSCFPPSDPFPISPRKKKYNCKNTWSLPSFLRNSQAHVPVPSPAWAQPSANVSALQGTAEREIRQIPPRIGQAHAGHRHVSGMSHLLPAAPTPAASQMGRPLPPGPRP